MLPRRLFIRRFRHSRDGSDYIIALAGVPVLVGVSSDLDYFA